MSGTPEVFAQPYAASFDVVGRVVTVLQGATERRGLQITELRSRAVQRGEIHELMLTDEDARLSSTVDRVGLIAFFEVVEPGVLIVGSDVLIEGSALGKLAGFDQTHMPNHQNVCVAAASLIDGRSHEVKLGAIVRFRFGEGSASGSSV